MSNDTRGRFSRDSDTASINSSSSKWLKAKVSRRHKLQKEKVSMPFSEEIIIVYTRQTSHTYDAVAYDTDQII